MATKTYFKKGDFVKVIKGEHSGKRGTVLKNRSGIATIRIYLFTSYLHVDNRNIVRCSLTGKTI